MRDEENRRKRRQTQRSRRATALPDRDPLRTNRTPVGLVQNALTALEKGGLIQGQRIVPLDPLSQHTLQTIVTRDAEYNRFVMELSMNGKVIPGAFVFFNRVLATLIFNPFQYVQYGDAQAA